MSDISRFLASFSSGCGFILAWLLYGVDARLSGVGATGWLFASMFAGLLAWTLKNK